MRLLIAVVQDLKYDLHLGPEPKTEKHERDEEAQFLELKIWAKGVNPNICENLEYWKKLVEDKGFYGLLVVIDYDKNAVEYLPLKTRADFDSITNLDSSAH